MLRSIYKRIYDEIKKYDSIVIARHIGADPDALASSIALRDIILNTFPNKKVYAVGSAASRFKYLGILDKFDEKYYENSLLIVTDTPDIERVDGVDPKRFKKKIKIDHHPVVDKYCDIEYIDIKSSSASQMIIELVFNTKLKLTKESAEKLYIGVVSDTNRFLYYYTTSKTFKLISKLLETVNIDITSLYEEMYLKPIKEKKLEGYIMSNLKITENGLGYLYVTDDILEQYGVDASTARNLVSNLNYIDNLYVWVILALDKNTGLIKGAVRSRGPIINDIASNYNGGGHELASGVRLKTIDELDELVNDLDEACKIFKNKI